MRLGYMGLVALAAVIGAVARPSPASDLAARALYPEQRGGGRGTRGGAPHKGGKVWVNYRGPREAARAKRQFERRQERAAARAGS